MSSSDRTTPLLRVITLAVGLVVFGLMTSVFYARFAYPVDAEWMVGSIRDTVDRVKAGEPIYGPPSATFISFLYPPLYFWLAAALARVTSTFVACKLVSIAASLATALFVAQAARALGASRFWTAIAALLHFACFPLTLFFYDLERVDPLSATMVAWGVASLLESKNTGRAALSGAILGLSFFAKQPGLLAFGAAALGLFVAGERKRALAVLSGGGFVLATVALYLEVKTGGWWRYYCLTLPRSHGLEPRLVSMFFVVDLPKAFALAAGSIAMVVWTARALASARRGEARPPWRDVVFAALVLAGMFGAWSLRSHRGGWANVLLAWTPLGCIAAGACASRLEERAARAGAARLVTGLLLTGTCLQFLACVFDPNDVSPEASDLREADRLRALVSSLEREGDVIVTPRGGLTRRTHYHSAALFDVLRAGGEAPPDYLAGLRSRAYAAILVDAPFEVHCKTPSCRAIDEALASFYFVAARLEEREHTGLAGFDARPRWVLRPRKAPLEGKERAFLEHRRNVEMGLAAMREQERGKGAAVVLDPAIEDIAGSPDPRWSLTN